MFIVFSQAAMKYYMVTVPVKLPKSSTGERSFNTSMGEQPVTPSAVSYTGSTRHMAKLRHHVGRVS